jgi:hypothetical protein
VMWCGNLAWQTNGLKYRLQWNRGKANSDRLSIIYLPSRCDQHFLLDWCKNENAKMYWVGLIIIEIFQIVIMGLDVNLEFGGSRKRESRTEKRDHSIPYNHAPHSATPSTPPPLHPPPQRDSRSFEINSRFSFSRIEKAVFEINNFYRNYAFLKVIKLFASLMKYSGWKFTKIRDFSIFF